MPLALESSENISFMIVVGGGGEDGIEQMAYQVGQKVLCDGGTPDQAEMAEIHWSQWTRATEYSDYRKSLEILLAVPGVREYTGLNIQDEDSWNPWPHDSDAFIDPMSAIEHTTIPILALYGELDKNVDPVQGAKAYTETLEKAGNQNYRIVVIPGAGHVLTPVETGCIGESGGKNYVPQYLQILEEWLQQLPN